LFFIFGGGGGRGGGEWGRFGLNMGVSPSSLSLQHRRNLSNQALNYIPQVFKATTIAYPTSWLCP